MKYESNNSREDRREDINRIIVIAERLAKLDAKFDSFIAEFLRNRELSEREIKDIINRLTLLEKEGAKVMRDGLASQHTAMVKLEAALHETEKCSEKLEDKYIRLKWIIGSITALVVPLITAIVTYIIIRTL